MSKLAARTGNNGEGIGGGENKCYSVTNRINTGLFDDFKCYKDCYKPLPQALRTQSFNREMRGIREKAESANTGKLLFMSWFGSK